MSDFAVEAEAVAVLEPDREPERPLLPPLELDPAELLLDDEALIVREDESVRWEELSIFGVSGNNKVPLAPLLDGDVVILQDEEVDDESCSFAELSIFGVIGNNKVPAGAFLLEPAENAGLVTSETSAAIDKQIERPSKFLSCIRTEVIAYPYVAV